ncbi:MAG: hypothetical protein QOF62_3747 [Pyrinomonadaceae bacterium]|jgi:hypothetical protein|nr:hypothetical protein [Pyrinomonadaceae bacterium]
MRMRTPVILSTLLVLFCCLGVAVETRAQAVTGYTEIDYYADTDTLDAYSETDLDWDLVGEYDAYVSLTIRDGNFSVVAQGSEEDQWNGVASVELFYSGTNPDTTYIAKGFHKPIADLWDYDYAWPYRTYYYDDYYFGYFENQGIYSPWYYYFLSPGFQEIHRRTAPISVGSTFDTDSVTTPPGNPDHLHVVSDNTGVVAGCTSVTSRQIKFKVVDSNGKNTGATPMQEYFSSLSTNTCRSDGAGPTPDSCAPTDSKGQFTDNITVNCNSVGGSCGYTITDQWQWCASGQTPATVGTLTETVHNNAITVNGVTTPDKLKGDIH